MNLTPLRHHLSNLRDKHLPLDGLVLLVVVHREKGHLFFIREGAECLGRADEERPSLLSYIWVPRQF